MRIHAPFSDFLEFIVGAENLKNLVDIHLLHVITRRRQVLTRIEVTRILREMLADRRGHRETRIGVDVDLANRALGGLAELRLRNADCVRKLAAELVDGINFILRNGA